MLAVDITTGLVGHWQLEENAIGQVVVDSSGSGNNGAHVNITAPDGPSTNAAVGSYSLSTDGVDDYVSVPPDSSLDLSGGQFTQSLWIYPENTGTGWHGILGFQPPSGSAERYPGIWIEDETKIHFGFGDGAAWNGFSTSNELTLSQWNHVVTTFDGTDYNAYVDGVLVRSTSSAAGLTPFPTQQVDIGRVNNNFDGQIDDVRIYTRALTQEDITALFTGIQDAVPTANVVNITQGSNIDISVRYQDDQAIDVSTLDSSDIRITGPGGFDQLATFVSVDDNTDGSPRTAVYSITAPTTNGTYTIAMEAGEVIDSGGGAVPAGSLANFQISDTSGEPDPTGLVGHWKLEESAIGQTVVDVSGLGNDGTHENITSPDGPNTNAVRGAYSLSTDGVDDYVSVAADPSLDLSGGEFTQSVWIYPEITTGGWHGILGYQGSGSSGQRYPSMWVEDFTKIHAGFGDGAWQSFTTGSVLTASQWNHVVTTFDGTDYKVYVDGSEVFSTAALAGLTPLPVQQVDIGRVNNHFEGLIDDVRIYKRVLDAAEVTLLFNGPAGDTTPPVASVANVAQGATVDITVSYVDDIAIDVSTLDNSDLRITGPGGFDQLATFVSVDNNTDGSPRSANYSITAPTTDGTYAVALESNQVSDTSSNFAASGQLATFQVGGDPNEPDPSGLVGHWKLEETAIGQTVVDASGIGNDGTHVNITVPDGPSSNAAVGNQSLSTDGVDDYVDIPADPSLDLSDGLFTQSIWIYPEDFGTGWQGVLGYQGSSGNGARYPGIWIEDSTKIHAGFGDGAWQSFTTPSILTLSQWNHVATTFDGTDYKVYVDGTEAYSTAALAGKTPVPTQQVNIGRINNNFDGLIDDVRIYKRVLDASEIALLANNSGTSPGTIQMADNTYSVNEQDGTVSVEVIRIGGSDGTVTVQYTTVDGTATAPEDYTAQAGTVTFLDGETTQFITVPIIDDTAGELIETFSVSLAGPGGGATLGFPRTRFVDITDNDPPPSTGNGLRGEYYDNINFTNLSVIRTDPTVNFNWGSGAPASGMGSNTFSVRWSGRVEPQFSETYAFHTTTDDGVRLWVDGQQIIDRWVDQSATTVSGTIDLVAGNRYDILMEYYENGGAAVAQLEWSSASQPLQVIPQSQLYDGSQQGTVVTFSTKLTTIDEAAGNAVVTVVRQGDASGTSSVQYATVDDTATAGSDYTAVSGTLNFGINETTRTISIPITNDGNLEPNETFDVTLSNPVGAVLGLQDFTQVRILDNDPGNFIRETVIDGLTQPTTFEWGPQGRLFVAQKNGVVKVFNANGTQHSTFIDISDEVNNRNDRGLLGFALHPNYPSTPYAYLLYTYEDPEELASSGRAGPDGSGNRVNRMIRVEGNPATQYTTALSTNRTVILGTNSTWDNISSPDQDSTSNPNIPPSCAPDGTLQDCIPSDSLSHAIGTVKFSNDGQSLFVSVGDGTSYGLVDERTDRVQNLDSLSGKILRIDPDTGLGLSDNPFVEVGTDLASNRAKVYSLGLRNPFRFALHPDTGEPFIGDVGWTSWEEINTGQGANFGWPWYEGGNGTSLQTGGYKDLPEAQAFYASGEPVEAPVYGRAHTAGVSAIIMGDFYTGSAFPSAYDNALFFADVNGGSIDYITFDPQGNPDPVRSFATGIPSVVQMATGPDGYLYFTNIAGRIERFVPGGSAPLSGPGGSGPGGASAGKPFFVPDAADDVTYYYESFAQPPSVFPLAAQNGAVEGLTGDPAGTGVWTVDAAGRVDVYDASGNQVSQWTAAGVTDAGGIATDGTDLWIVDRASGKVLHFQDGVSLDGGSQTASSSFDLDSANQSPSGLATDGQFMWITDDQADQVFKYTTEGFFAGSWELDGENVDPQGVTNDIGGYSPTLWIVDAASDRVFAYPDGANYVADAGTASASYPLAEENNASRGIVDVSQIDIDSIGTSALNNPQLRQDVNNDRDVSVLDALIILNWLGLGGSGESEHYIDVNGDWKVTALDALEVINYLAQQLKVRLIGEAESLNSDLQATDAAISTISESPAIQVNSVGPGTPAQTAEIEFALPDDDEDEVVELLAEDLQAAGLQSEL